MKILVTGSTGLVGTALVNVLARDGNMVCRLMRPQSKSPASSKDGFDVAWNPATGELGGAGVGADGVGKLGGGAVAGGRGAKGREELLRARRIGTKAALGDGPAAQ